MECKSCGFPFTYAVLISHFVDWSMFTVTVPAVLLRIFSAQKADFSLTLSFRGSQNNEVL